MMSDKVIKTDSFMEMPHSTKNLYFYLMIEADDDGFVSNPKTIMRMVNAAEDDYKILVGKKFVVPFESGVCVIKHWLIHNLIRADRKVDTQWAEEKKLLIVDTDTQKYSLNKGLQPNDNQVSTKCPHRLGKVRLGKVSIKKETLPLGEFENVNLSDIELEKLTAANGKEAVTQIIEELSCYIETSGKEYKSHYLTASNWLRRKNKTNVSKEVHQVFTLFKNPASALWPNRGHEVVAAQVLLDTYGLETLERRVARVIKEAKNGDQFFPNAVTPSQLLDKMPAIERYLGK